MDQEKEMSNVIKEMHQIPQEGNYYAITLLANADGEATWSCFSHFVDYSADRKWEIRAPSLIKPDIMARNWEMLGQNFITVRDEPSMLFFWSIGGHALVEKSIAESLIPEVLTPTECTVEGLKPGFTSVRALPQRVLNHAPTPKLRMQILNRDQRRCKICGRSPDNHVDLELHVHHIRPWAKGGLTLPENLITLCHTCHKGLEPHEDQTLSALIAEEQQTHSNSVSEALKDYTEGVNNYRRVFHKIWKEFSRGNS